MSITNTAVTVANTATVVAATDPTRRRILFHNPNATTIYLGGSGVTTANGLPIVQNATITVEQYHREDTSAQQAWYGIVTTGTQPLRVIEVDN